MRKGNWGIVLLAAALLVLLTAVPATSAKKVDPTEAQIRAMMGQMNAQLEARGENVRVWVVETITASHQEGQTVYFDDRTKQLGSHWVPGDPRRGGYMDIAWLSDQVDGDALGPSLIETQAAVDRAMNTWNDVTCSQIPLTKLPDFGVDWGYVEYLSGYGGGVPGWLADITHAGWLGPELFDDLAPNGSHFILGVTFTFIWIDGGGIPTDIDNNRKTDVAFREIYYNNDHPWAVDEVWVFPTDVESIVLHETGHGLSLGHFGKLFKTDANGKFHFAPEAVMNAGYVWIQQTLKGTDIASFCSIWASWPNK